MHQEWTQLRSEVEALRQTVQRLQSGGRPRGRWRRFGLIGLGLALGLLAARLPTNEAQAVTQDNNEKELVCSSLKVVGPNGKKTLLLSTDDDGGIMEIYGNDGNVRTIVAVAPKQGGGLVNLFDTRKKLRLVLEGSDQGAIIEKR